MNKNYHITLAIAARFIANECYIIRANSEEEAKEIVKKYAREWLEVISNYANAAIELDEKETFVSDIYEISDAN